MAVQRIDLQKIPDPRGNLSVVEPLRDIPFDIARAFLMYDVPGGEVRGGHAYKQSREFIIALSGSFDVVTKEGGHARTHSLNRSYYGLYVPNGVWRHMENFSTNALALVLSSTHFDESDYLYDYEDYLKWWESASSQKEAIPSKKRASFLKGGHPFEKEAILPVGHRYLDTVTLMDLPRIDFREGNITPLEGNSVVPFDIKRVFYIYDIPGGESRGAHAHKHCHQLIIAASGSFEVLLDNGSEQVTVTLNRPYQALHIPPGVWSHEAGFSSGAVCLVLTSELFDEDDYIRDYETYLNTRSVQSSEHAGLQHPQQSQPLPHSMAFYDLQRLTRHYADGIKAAVGRVIDSGWFLLGKEVATFEQNYANYIGAKHCIGVGNGLDALRLILRGYKELGQLNDGDEIIVPANTYIATILAITDNGLTPVLVEPDANTLQLDAELLEAALTQRTKAVMLVHLYGQNAWNERIAAFCDHHQLLLLEDNAQAAGCVAMTKTGPKKTGSLGQAAAHSFYPTKTLGALGDAGAVTTNDDELAEAIRSLANYGSSQKYVFTYQGCNSRLDEIHAAVLDYKLRHLDSENEDRRRIARRYQSSLTNLAIELPALSTGEDNVWHLFPLLVKGNTASSDTLSQRDALQQQLAAHGIQTQIHYPIPPHKQSCYSAWNGITYPITESIHARELSLPISPVMTEEEVKRVIDAVNTFNPNNTESKP